MTPADLARNAAISLEAKKDALAQRQSGDWKISFTVQGADMDARLTKAAMGTRFAMVLVEIGDDEQPVNRKEAMRTDAKHSDAGAVATSVDSRPEPNPPARAKREKMDWRDMQPAAQAGLRCAEPLFRAFLREVKRYGHCDEEEAAIAVRDICGVKSRAELGTIHAARVIWHQLDTEYLAWRALERVGA